MTTKLKMFLEKSSGEKVPVTDDGLKIMFDSTPSTNGQETGVKLMISMCLHGLESEITQSLAHQATVFLKSNQ